ncbi:hypothetical protein BO86DRAFT_408476 [Aspergillus japonicus CBS 114.51]|uniref:Uncharacterized protein n=1 Tax=Aspergillus japonicus CBS 114.51 TaxID=1448312 RepID=A0A8T8X5S2_ASPJA|nr:hypothetical protein BO86DRAFT_408476 [Aspergillus japonicus CBS 114.51]RAH83517.1 hypothetical protein BO86DRAFT_408476 [Aspergillus japonicus CBS 114.51]
MNSVYQEGIFHQNTSRSYPYDSAQTLVVEPTLRFYSQTASPEGVVGRSKKPWAAAGSLAAAEIPATDSHWTGLDDRSSPDFLE